MLSTVSLGLSLAHIVTHLLISAKQVNILINYNMPSTAFLGLPLAHYITICFNYSFLTNFLSMPPF